MANSLSHPRLGPGSSADCARVQHAESQAGLDMAQGTSTDDQSPGGAGEIRVGHRFKMSDLGMARCPRIAHKVGTVVGLIEYSKTVIVRLDGNKLKTSINRDYIKRL